MRKAGDVVVFVPGIGGSILVREGKAIWGSGGAATFRVASQLVGAVKGLRLDAELKAGPARDGVESVGLLPDLHLIPGLWSVGPNYTSVFRWLQTRLGADTIGGIDGGGSLHAFHYDWRLSSRHTAQRLALVVDEALWAARRRGVGDPKAVLVGHSMGGLVADTYVRQLGGAEHVRSVITFGTPFRGAPKAVTAMTKGLGLGFVRPRSLVEAVRSWPSAAELLPEYACIEVGEDGLAKLHEVSVTGLPAECISWGRNFHALSDGGSDPGRVVYRPLLTRRHATPAAIVLDADGLPDVRTDTDRFDAGGDGTVPHVAAIPRHMDPSDPLIGFLADRHGQLPGSAGGRAVLDGIFAGADRPVRGSSGLGLSVDEVRPRGDWSVMLSSSSPATHVVEVRSATRVLHRAVVQSWGGRGTSITVPDLGSGPVLVTAGRQVAAQAPLLDTVSGWSMCLDEAGTGVDD